MSSQPATMAEAASAGASPLHRGLPDEIAIWEILVRVPPKALLRCRAVCRAWRRATSTVDFLLAHHGRQPCLPLLYEYGYGFEYGPCRSCDIIPFDHRAAAAAQLRDVATLKDGRYHLRLRASCDGLLILSTAGSSGASCFSVCNPATRQYARLPLIRGFMLLGMYPHPATGEYRLLLSTDPDLMYDGPGVQEGCYVFALGSDKPLRQIGHWEPEGVASYVKAVLFRGSLHWYTELHEGEGNMIMVFDTTAESFLEMQAPVVSGLIDLFEMHGMLGMSSFNDEEKNIDIWVLPDYKSEVWTFKYRIELAVAEIRMQCDVNQGLWSVMVVPGDGELLVLVRFDKWLLQVDMDSKLVASFYRERLCLSQLRLKQTLVPHTFFPALEGYVVNDSPFISKVVK
ncbi:unnamed protein product [Alopecurus aequalis]